MLSLPVWIFPDPDHTGRERPSEVRRTSPDNPLLQRRIRVLVVDGHAAVRHTLATCITATDDLDLVGEAGSGEEAVRICDRILPTRDSTEHWVSSKLLTIAFCVRSVEAAWEWFMKPNSCRSVVALR